MYEFLSELKRLSITDFISQISNGEQHEISFTFDLSIFTKIEELQVWFFKIWNLPRNKIIKTASFEMKLWVTSMWPPLKVYCVHLVFFEQNIQYNIYNMVYYTIQFSVCNANKGCTYTFFQWDFSQFFYLFLSILTEFHWKNLGISWINFSISVPLNRWFIISCIGALTSYL